MKNDKCLSGITFKRNSRHTTIGRGLAKMTPDITCRNECSLNFFLRYCYEEVCFDLGFYSDKWKKRRLASFLFITKLNCLGSVALRTPPNTANSVLISIKSGENLTQGKSHYNCMH